MGLYLVAGPIGNLKDISLRALETLENADFIFCEDTRVSGKLLSCYNIKSNLNSYHEHSSKTKLNEILDLLKKGKNVAYLSDAGMPCISDPGKELVKLAIENNLDYSLIPGASAVVSAFAVSCFDENRFTFVGFLDRNRYKSELEELQDIKTPIILYESPHRIKTLLEEILKLLGDRRLTIAREMTKLHESFLHGRVSRLLKHPEICHPKGEFVIVMEGSTKKSTLLSEEELIRVAKQRLEEGEKLSEVAKDLSKMGKMSRGDLYKALSELK